MKRYSTLLLLPFIAFFGCNRNTDNTSTGSTAGYVNERSSSDRLALDRERLRERADLAARNAGKKIVELKIAQVKAKEHLKAGMKLEMMSLQEKKQRLENIMVAAQEASSDVLLRYREEVETIIRDKSLDK